MAKKKAAKKGNDRGFATSSIPKKVVVEPEIEIVQEITPVHSEETDIVPSPTIDMEEELRRAKISEWLINAKKASEKEINACNIKIRVRKSYNPIELDDNVVDEILEWYKQSNVKNKIPLVTADLAENLVMLWMILEDAGFDEQDIFQCILEYGQVELKEALDWMVLYAQTPREYETAAPLKNEPQPLPPSSKITLPASADVSADDDDTSSSSDENDPEQLQLQYVELKLQSLRIKQEVTVLKRDETDSPEKLAELRKHFKKAKTKISRIERDPLFDKQRANVEIKSRMPGLYDEMKAISREKSDDLLHDSVNDPDLDDYEVINDDVDDETESENEGNIGEVLEKTEILVLEEKSDNMPVLPSRTILDLSIQKGSKGVSPERVLADFCKTKDRNARLRFEDQTNPSYSRADLIIYWSNSRNEVFEIPQTKACGSSKEARDYVSVVALAALTDYNTKSQSYNKLFKIFRDLWDELKAENNETKISKWSNRLTLIEERLKVWSDLSPVTIFNPPTGPKAERNIGRENAHDLNGSMQPMVEYNPFSAHYQQMLKYREQLPIWSYKDTIIRTIEDNQVVLLCGETGCGKSTQTPSIILESMLNQGQDCFIYCTEPRRISAITLAQRVSQELGETKGSMQSGRSLVGYAVRLESSVTPSTRLVYATTGVVLRMLEDQTEFVSTVSHLIVDEVHERSIDSDFLLILLKKLLEQRPRLKVILMSATVDADRFSQYMNNCPVLFVPGRTYPVERYWLEDILLKTNYQLSKNSPYLVNENQRHSMKDTLALDDGDDDFDKEVPIIPMSQDQDEYPLPILKTVRKMNEYLINYELIIKLIEHVYTDPSLEFYRKAILIFLPGIAEISRLADSLSDHPIFRSENFRVFILHSTIANDDQESAFDILPKGQFKIVLSTNIAETGVTIPDITCVIDTGKHKEMRFDAKRQVSKLVETFVAQSNAVQRSGRAGRVQEGISFSLLSKTRYYTLPAHPTPEIMRLGLHELALRVKVSKLGDIEATLLEALDPPTPSNIRHSVAGLIEAKALTNNESITDLGSRLARLPMDVYVGRLALFGLEMKCLDAALTIAAVLSSKSIYLDDSKEKLYSEGYSDFITAYRSFTVWRDVCLKRNSSDFDFCNVHNLSRRNLIAVEELRQQFFRSLIGTKFIHYKYQRCIKSRSSVFHRGRYNFLILDSDLDKYSGDTDILSACIAAAFYPQLLLVNNSGAASSYTTFLRNQAVNIHPTSILASKYKIKLSYRYAVYYGLMKSHNLYALNIAPFPEICIPILCPDVVYDRWSGIVSIDANRLRFSASNPRVLLAMKIVGEVFASHLYNQSSIKNGTGNANANGNGNGNGVGNNGRGKVDIEFWIGILKRMIRPVENMVR